MEQQEVQTLKTPTASAVGVARETGAGVNAQERRSGTRPNDVGLGAVDANRFDVGVGGRRRCRRSTSVSEVDVSVGGRRRCRADARETDSSAKKAHCSAQKADRGASKFDVEVEMVSTGPGGIRMGTGKADAREINTSAERYMSAKVIKYGGGKRG
ncbi:hypothetical protein GY45DRAFT_1341410 [Cubamyces sp. BRFM 1775]|nr:hypothetical protein GY45DRAFT_1341410 [Cubamyces sp. BRFM 1775]